jgi:Flp pilus assembly protein protease CpaA
LIRRAGPALEQKTMPLSLLWILTLGLVVLALYDLRTQRVPNWVTLPLLLTGLVLHFPGAPETWLGCLLLFSAWRFGGLGGGDAKLWMALLWLVPRNLAGRATLAMAAALLLTASAQALWRKLRGRPMWGVRGPGAWRVLPFGLWLLVAV